MKALKILAMLICILFVSCNKELPIEADFETADKVLSKKIRLSSSPTAELFVRGLDSPEGMDFVRSNLFVVESNPSRLLRIEPDGEISTVVNFQAGRLIDVLAANPGVFVSDLDQGNIYLVEENGQFSTFVSGLNGPTRMTLSSAGEIFVTELSGLVGEKVTKISKEGTQTTVIVYDDNQNINPNGLDFDHDGNLYVVEGTGEIRKFEFVDGTTLPINASTVPPFVSGLSSLGGLAIDKKGNLWTLSNTELFRISPSGSVTTVVSGLVGPFNGVGINRIGRIFFSDYGSGDIFFLVEN